MILGRDCPGQVPSHRLTARCDLLAVPGSAVDGDARFRDAPPVSRRIDWYSIEVRFDFLEWFGQADRLRRRVQRTARLSARQSDAIETARPADGRWIA